jgi:hypothetical protein
MAGLGIRIVSSMHRQIHMKVAPNLRRKYSSKTSSWKETSRKIDLEI